MARRAARPGPLGGENDLPPGHAGQDDDRPASARFCKGETGGTAVLLNLFLIGLAPRSALCR